MKRMRKRFIKCTAGLLSMLLTLQFGCTQRVLAGEERMESLESAVYAGEAEVGEEGLLTAADECAEMKTADQPEPAGDTGNAEEAVLENSQPILESAGENAGKDKKVVQTNPEIAPEPEGEEEHSQEAGTAAKAAGNVMEIDSALYPLTEDGNQVFFGEDGSCLYFLKKSSEWGGDYDLVFYDLSTGESQVVYSYKDAEEYYVAKDAVYFAKTKVTSKEGQEGYDCLMTITKYSFREKAASEITAVSDSDNNWAGYISALGVDSRGKIYVATNDDELLLYDAKGTLLDRHAFTGRISEFYGFDETNGNFYYRGNYNWVYWGYDHDMTSLMAGNVGEDNSITMPEKNLSILYQTYFFEHRRPVEMLNGQYLALLTTFSDDTLMLLDSNAYDHTDYTEQSTSIDLADSGVSVSALNVKDMSVVKLALTTAASKYEDNIDISSAGPRCALSGDEKSLIVKTQDKLLTEYNIESKSKKLQAETAHPVYDFKFYGDTCVVLERENGKFFVETLEWTYPTDFEADVPPVMKVGDSRRISCWAEGAGKLDYTFSSSNPKVLGADEKGNLLAWKAGQAVITVKAPLLGLVKTFTVNIEESEVSGNKTCYRVVKANGTISENIHKPGNAVYGQTVESYLDVLPDGGYQRVEYIGKRVFIETYDSSFKLKSTKKLNCELPVFGGFFSSQQYNFLVFGKMNKKEKNNEEVIRVVKYSKAWKRLGACSIKGANTYIPFDAGSLSMAEHDDILYIHTCHEMYQSEDGLHHQANCTFCVKQSNMKLEDSYYDVMNLSVGYVSHSFMQLVRTDEDYVYRVDLGDAYPRGIAFSMAEHKRKINQLSAYGTIMNIPGYTGDNYTGYSLSGFELSDQYGLVVGNGLASEGDKTRNIWTVSVEKEEGTSRRNWITKEKGRQREIQPPKLVKLNDNQFLLMWEEYTKNKGKYTTKAALVGGDGKLASKVFVMPLALGGCNPVVNKKGEVVWYVTNDTSPAFVTLNPFQLQTVQEKAKKITLFSGKQQNWYQTGDKFRDEKLEYKVTGKGKVAVIGCVSKNTKKVVIPDQVMAAGKTYKVTSIASGFCQGQKKLKSLSIGRNVASVGKNAFNGCSKLKNIVIRTAKLKAGKVGAKAFWGIHPKAKVKVPAAKLAAYRKWLRARGVKGKRKVVK